MSDVIVTKEMALEHGLTEQEYQDLCDTLGRVPSITELGVASVMWSEHCSYKSSRVHLKKLPTKGPHVLVGPGENAGVVDIGDNQAVVFKMESHNHPSFLEPYQGAATGVGGICRDVFTMGARPIALADCLRFGDPAMARTKYLVGGVVSGIGDYGNSFGVPNVAGDVAFDDSYNGNILVNAFCLGLAPADKIFLGEASGLGNPILYVGAKTGRDGIHGATMASAEFGDDSSSQRPAVQVGDPFMEKLLLEACLELMETDYLVGIQDMGAAGLTSSSVEMAARAGSGVDMDLDKVPARETGMTAYELMLSESQERMLMVVEKGREQDAINIFEKWDLDAVVVGEVTDTERVVVRKDGNVVADLPAKYLAEGVVYERPMEKPQYVEKCRTMSTAVTSKDVEAELKQLLSHPTIASKAWVIEQYDQSVRHGTVIKPGEADAGVVRVIAGDKAKGVAITAGCNQRAVYIDPYEGTRLSVAEAYANLSAVGARPLAVTNCLNFGNPERPEIMWQFGKSVAGLGDACKMLETPVISGNVSLYNETNGEAIKPTPMIAMVGLVDDVSQASDMSFEAPLHPVYLIGEPEGNLSGSSYLALVHGIEGGALPVLRQKHRQAMDFVRHQITQGVLNAAHDISDGGLLVAALESCSGNRLGVSLDCPDYLAIEKFVFGEGPARFIVSCQPAREQALQAAASDASVTITKIGVTTDSSFELTYGADKVIETTTKSLLRGWTDGFSHAVS